MAAAQCAVATTTNVSIERRAKETLSMSKADLNTTEFALFHPAAHYGSPNEVLNDQQLSDAEKRVILSSWASDMYVVESCPSLREIPGMDHTIRLADILAALRRLDGADDPPRGEIGTRWRRPRWGAETRRLTSC
jgi:hypothetical protein